MATASQLPVLIVMVVLLGAALTAGAVAVVRVGRSAAGGDDVPRAATREVGSSSRRAGLR